MPSLIGVTDGTGVAIAANYLVVKQSPGAAYADKDGNIITASPLLTFNTPNLQMFKVTLTGCNLTATPTAPDSDWSRAIRALQVTSEIFAVFPPTLVANGAGESDDVSTFCFLAPDFNTNTGAAAVTGSVQSAIAQRGGGFSVVETALTDAVGGTAAVIRCMLVGAAVVDDVAPV